MAQHVVIGAGPDALRAAAVRATAGPPVLLLQAGASPSGLVHPELPQDTGRMRVSDEHRELTEQILGALVEAPDNGQGVLARKQVAWLPLRRRKLAAMLPPQDLVLAARTFLEARSRASASEMVAGGGQEERSYRDWVVRRFGEPVYELLYKAYAEQRFGSAGDALSVTVARYHHGLPDPGPHQVAGGRYDVALQEAETRILEAGGEIRTGAQVEALELEEGRVAAVRLVGGERLPVHGPVWVARPPATVIDWLPADAVAGVREDARRLQAKDLVVTCLKGEVDGLPEVLHVLDPDSSFWQVVSPYGIKEYALFLSTVPAGASAVDPADQARQVAEDARRMGLGDFELEGIRVERVVGFQPVWRAGCHARFHRVIARYAELGLVGVGRSGSFSFVDPGEEIALASAYRDTEQPDQREALRRIADPPLSLQDLRISLRRFIER